MSALIKAISAALPAKQVITNSLRRLAYGMPVEMAGTAALYGVFH